MQEKFLLPRKHLLARNPTGWNRTDIGSSISGVADIFRSAGAR